jgi:WD40 repeat protein
MALAAATRLGPYEIRGLLGAGGMGEVYRALDPRLGREVAVKVLPEEVGRDPDRLARFEREARAVAALNHPSILTVHDVGTHEGMPYVVMELLEGETLRELLSRHAPTQRQVLSLAVQAARGLEAAHAKGILHRDLKPENLFLTTDGRLKILDFGLAKLVAGETAGSQEATASSPSRPGQMVGTVGYMSPEQVRGLPVDGRTDLFSLGVVLYEALGGKHPFRRDTAVGTLAAILEEAPAELSVVSPAVSPALGRIVGRCLEKAADDRIGSAHDLAVALEAIQAEPRGAVLPPGLAERGPYPGLHFFTEQDAGRFFGREGEIETLWGRLRGRRLLAVIGPSGAGKTSFVRAGVVATRPSGWAAAVTTPGTSPLLMLGQALAPELAGDPQALRQLVRFEDPEAAFEVLLRWRKAHAEALLVVDQLEELFTLNPKEAVARFAAFLGRLAKDGDVHVLLSLRDDFLMRCGEHEALVRVFTELTPLLPMGRDALRRALVEPAKREGYRFEDEALVEEMVDSVEGARGALPLLAFAVARLWERRDRERKLLTRAAYEEIGGVAGALAQHAEATMDRIGPERQGTVREIFRNLVTAEGTRAVMDREELLSIFLERKDTEEVLRQLVEERLLTTYEVEGAEGEPSHHRVEVVHESLLKAWPRLVRWQAQDEEGAVLRDQLKQAAHLWEEKGRSPDVLWSGTAYREFELWRERYAGKLTALEEQYAQAMVERARRQRRLRHGAVAAAFLVLAGVSAAIAVSRHQAARARDQARAEALRAEASRLVTLGQLRLADDPTEALAYATASLELADTPEARAFVMKALWEAPPSFTLPVGPPAQRGALFSPDGTRLVAVDHHPVQLLWNESGGAPTPLSGHEVSERGPTIAGWSADGHLVTGMCCGLATRVHVWSTEGKKLRTIELGPPTRWQVGKEHMFGETEEGPPGSRVLLLRSWRLPDGEASVLGRVPTNVKDPSVAGVFLPDGTGWAYARGGALFVRPLSAGSAGGEQLVGRQPADIDLLLVDERGQDRMASRDKTGEIRLWTPSRGRLDLDRVIPRPANAPSSVFPAEPRWVHGHAWHDKKVRLWDLEALPGSRPLELRRSGSWNVAWPHLHPRGDWLTVFQINEGRAAFWPLRKPYPSVVDGYTSMDRPLAFSPDGRWLATTWAMSTKLRLWPLSGDGPREPKVLGFSPEGFTEWTRIVFDPYGRYLFAVAGYDSAWIVPLDGAPPRRLPAYAEETILLAAAVSPTGRRVATAWWYGPGPRTLRTLRLHDVDTGETRVFPLPTEAASSRFTGEVYEGAVDGIGFRDETTAYTSGWAGLRRWDLEKGTSELVAADVDFFGFPGPARRLALTGAPMPGREAKSCRQLQTRDLVSGKTEAVGPPGVCVGAPPAAVSGEVFAVPGPDGVLVGRVSGDAAHLLVGHEGPVQHVAVSPDGRWVATSGEDNTLRLWPMPDLSKAPLHTLPHDELLARLKSLTNLRVVRAPESQAGWKFEIGPFPGWKDVPTW